MHKKLYISPEFEWLGIDLVDDVLSLSLPDNGTDTGDGSFEDYFGDDGIGEDGGGVNGGSTDVGEDWW